VYRSPDNSSYSLVASLGANATAYTDAGLTAGSTYYYYLLAYNTNGNSPASNIVSGVPQGGSGGGGDATDLFISEYIEGSSFNKALEIANYTGASVNLSGYVLRKETNGGGSWGSDYALSGTLANGAVWVIANSSADAAILAQADISTGSGIVTFNGNDVIGLFKNGTLIDILGNFGSSANYAQNQTLIRKSDVSSPNATYTTSEWDFLSSNTFGNIGSHTYTGTPILPPATPTNLDLLATTIDLNLSWDDVAAEDGYELYRSNDNVNFSLLSSLAADQTSYTDASVALETPYYYYVLAFNAGGNSANSNVVSGQTEPTGPSATELFISEYIEGSSFNKALEIANFTGASVNLSGYVLRKQTNGAGAWGSEYALSGTLAQGEVWVIANSSANAGILAEADVATGSGIVTFNGNDAIGLFKNGSLIDMLGTFNDASNYAQNQTLIRKSSIESPNTSYTPGEWDVFGTDVIADLGIHTFDGGGLNPPAAPANLSLVATTSSLDLSWDDLANEDGYLLYRSADNVNFSQIASLTADVTSYSDVSMPLETVLYYYLTAFNADGISPASATVNGQTIPVASGAADLFISEYVEGTQRNRAIEIANFTGSSVNLSDYSLKRQANGNGNWRNEFSLSGTLSDGDVFVLGRSDASSGITSVADQLTTAAILNISGNDPIGLFKNGALIDIVGPYNGGGVNFGRNVTLVRKSSVVDPTTSYDVSEWDAFSRNTFTYLGSHTYGTGSRTLAPSLMIAASPNPFSSTLQVRFSLPADEAVDIEILNLMGQSVQTIISGQAFSEGENLLKVQTNGLSAGLYLLKISTARSSQTIRIIKQ
ncbi:MAG: lamin tail domain-containing protein, partial [Bacteroidota bacterium]